MQSWLGVAQQWHHGTLYPHWFEVGNYGAGEPRFIFYPPLTWMLGALLGIILAPLLSWSAAPIAFTLIILTACGVTMNKLAREWLPPNAATVAACAYILNPYALFVAYERTAYAELAAGIWLPLIILYALHSTKSRHPERSAHPNNVVILSGGVERSERPQSKDLRSQPWSGAPFKPSFGLSGINNWPPRSIIPLALTIAAIWLTNAPAAVMACYALGAITIWVSIATKSWRPIINSTITLILGLGLASFYIVPAAYERRWVDIARAIGSGMRIEDSFLFGHTGESFHDMVLRTASWIFVTMLATIAIAASVAWKRKTAPRLLLPLSVTTIALFALQLRWSNVIWRFAPELKFLQFPWRWSLVLSIVFALALGAASTVHSPKIAEKSFRFYAAGILLAAIAAVSLGGKFFWQPCDDEDVVSAQVAVFNAGTGFEGTDEYTPLGADNSLIQQGLPQVRVLNSAHAEIAPDPATEDQNNPTYTPSPQEEIAADIKVDQWQSEYKNFTISSQASGYAVLRLLDYPSWQLRLNGAIIATRPHRDDGLITIAIQPGLNRIDVQYATTPDAWYGRALTIASLAVLSAFAALGYRRRPQDGVPHS
jgi:hypothetical protein